MPPFLLFSPVLCFFSADTCLLSLPSADLLFKHFLRNPMLVLPTKDAAGTAWI
jgi:hypothetical protein